MSTGFTVASGVFLMAAFVSGVYVGKKSVEIPDIVEMDETEFRQHESKVKRDEAIRSLMLSEQRAQVRRDYRKSISGKDKEDLIGIIKGAFND